MQKAILLASGGLDSTTVAFKLAKEKIDFLPIFFDYGQHCAELEWNRLKEVLPKTSLKPERVNISALFQGSLSRMIKEANLWEDNIKDEDLYIPYRTMLFFAAAAARAQIHNRLNVFTGFINSNHAKEIDCTNRFMNNLGRLTEKIGPVRFFSPFRNASKTDVVRFAIALGVPIGRTFSCQASSQFPCGACPNCVERLGALSEAGLI